MRIRELREPDRDEWLRMRRDLWPELPPTDLEAETRDYFSCGMVWNLPTRVLVVERSDLPAAEGLGVARGDAQAAALAGFVEVSLRQAAPGCSTSPVAYIEAWYVDPDPSAKGAGQGADRGGGDVGSRAGLRGDGIGLQLRQRRQLRRAPTAGVSAGDRAGPVLEATGSAA